MIYLFHFLCMRSNKSSDSSGSNVVITNIANIGRTKRKKGLFELLTCLWSIFWSLEIQRPCSTSHQFGLHKRTFRSLVCGKHDCFPSILRFPDATEYLKIVLPFRNIRTVFGKIRRCSAESTPNFEMSPRSLIFEEPL